MPLPRNLSIRRSLMVVTMLATGAALLSASAAFVGYDVVSFRRDMALRLETVCRVLSYNGSSVVVFHDEEAASFTLAALHAEPHVVAAGIYDRDGRRLASYQRPGATDSVPEALAGLPAVPEHRFTRSRLQISQPIVFEGAPIGGVLVVADLDEIGQRVRSYALIVGLVSLAAFAVALAVSARLQGTISEPILRLAEVARVVSRDKDYSIRATHRGSAELGLLVDTFNEMLSEIQERDHELHEARRRLEDRVEERTADLKRTQLLLAEAQRLAHTGNWEWDVEKDVVWWSEEMYRLHGVAPGDFPPTYEGILGFVHPEDRPEFTTQMGGASSDGGEFELDYRIRRRDGSVRDLHAFGRVHSSGEGGAVRVVGATQDVTERKKADERFRTFLEAAPDAIVITNSSGQIVLVNSQTEKLFGYGRAELVGRPVETLVPPELRERHVHHRAGYAADLRVRAMGSGLALHGRRKDGSQFPIEISLSPLPAEEGTLIFSGIRDITERRQSEEEIKSLNERLERRAQELEVANRELESFSYSVSHDLRAPLRAIDGFSLALLEDYGGQLDGQGKDHLGRVRRATQTMGMLIDDLLKLARVARSEMKREDVNLSGLAEEVAAGLRDRQPERPVEFAAAPGLVEQGDSRLLRVLFDNLLGNAWKFSSKQAQPRVELGRTEVNGGQAYFVRDNGAGFDMTYAGKLFGAFQRLHTASEFPGTGIGLATCARIVHRHGGRIWAESAPGRGATFFFTLGGEQ